MDISQIVLHKFYESEGGFKVILVQFDESSVRPYFGYLYHAGGRIPVLYYINFTCINPLYNLKSEWLEGSELPILYQKETPLEKFDNSFMPKLKSMILNAIESNKHTWYVDDYGNKYRGSKTWQAILDYRIETKTLVL